MRKTRSRHSPYFYLCIHCGFYRQNEASVQIFQYTGAEKYTQFPTTQAVFESFPVLG